MRRRKAVAPEGAEVAADPPAETTEAADPFSEFVASAPPAKGGAKGEDVPELPGEIAGIVRLALTVDVEAEYRRLREALEPLGPRRLDPGAVLDALDRVESDTVAARRIHRAAVISRDLYELDVRPRVAALRDEAQLALAAEKDEGKRRKQITNDDVEDAIMVRHPDLWREIKRRRAEFEGVVEVLSEMVESFRSRQASIRAMAGK